MKLALAHLTVLIWSMPVRRRFDLRGGRVKPSPDSAHRCKMWISHTVIVDNGDSLPHATFPTTAAAGASGKGIIDGPRRHPISRKFLPTTDPLEWSRRGAGPSADNVTRQCSTRGGCDTSARNAPPPVEARLEGRVRTPEREAHRDMHAQRCGNH